MLNKMTEQRPNSSTISHTTNRKLMWIYLMMNYEKNTHECLECWMLTTEADTIKDDKIQEKWNKYNVKWDCISTSKKIDWVYGSVLF